MEGNINGFFERALTNGAVFEFLTGQDGYEIRLWVADMPTDVDLATFLIRKHVDSVRDFDSSAVVDAFVGMSKDARWAWLVVYYVGSFLENGLGFLPVGELYGNLRLHRDALKKDDGWVCFNFGPEVNNLWDVIVNENNRLKKNYSLPDLA